MRAKSQITMASLKRKIRIDSWLLRRNHLLEALLLCTSPRSVILCSTRWGQCWAEGFHSEFISSPFSLPPLWPAHTQHPHTGCWCRRVQLLIIREVLVCVCVCVCVIRNPHRRPSTPSSCLPPSVSTSPHPSLCYKTGWYYPLTKPLCGP